MSSVSGGGATGADGASIAIVASGSEAMMTVDGSSSMKPESEE